jgi:hypothetical protein
MEVKVAVTVTGPVGFRKKERNHFWDDFHVQTRTHEAAGRGSNAEGGPDWHMSEEIKGKGRMTMIRVAIPTICFEGTRREIPWVEAGSLKEIIRSVYFGTL